MRPKVDPFIAAVITAVVTCGALALGIVLDWFGDDLGVGNDYCEALRDGLINQPANTFSNLGFVIAGLAIGWQARRDPGAMGSLSAFYASVVVTLGPASAAMHATGTVLGKHFDLTSMFLVASFVAAYGLARLFGGGLGLFHGLFWGFLAVSEVVYFFGPPVPVILHAGNVVFALLLLVGAGAEVMLWRRDREPAVLRWGVAAFGSLAVAFTVWNLDQRGWCDPDSLLQGHAAWHVLCAVSAWCLFGVYRKATAIT